MKFMIRVKDVYNAVIYHFLYLYLNSEFLLKDHLFFKKIFSQRSFIMVPANGSSFFRLHPPKSITKKETDREKISREINVKITKLGI